MLATSRRAPMVCSEWCARWLRPAVPAAPKGENESRAVGARARARRPQRAEQEQEKRDPRLLPSHWRSTRC